MFCMVLNKPDNMQTTCALLQFIEDFGVFFILFCTADWFGNQVTVLGGLLVSYEVLHFIKVGKQDFVTVS